MQRCLFRPSTTLVHVLRPVITATATAKARRTMMIRTKQSIPKIFDNTTHTLPEFSIAEKVILVTGGGRGLGLTQGEALAQAGAIVYALDIHPAPPPDFVETVAKTPNLHYRRVDVRDAALLDKTVRGIGETEGRVDGMIAAAGILNEVEALDCDKETFNRMLEINVTGCFLSAQACAREMVRLGKKNGSICLVASMSGVIANKDVHMTAYNASKGAVHQLARNLAAEWGSNYGIRVNTLSPGYIETRMVEELFVRHPERREAWSAQNMLGRISAPKEYRGAAVFLMSDASSYMTGADLMIDGGHHAW